MQTDFLLIHSDSHINHVCPEVSGISDLLAVMVAVFVSWSITSFQTKKTWKMYFQIVFCTIGSVSPRGDVLSIVNRGSVSSPTCFSNFTRCS